jgi:hypothetical protein
MSRGSFERRHAILVGVCLAIILILRYGVFGERQPVVVDTVDSVPMAEGRLKKLREIAATEAGKQAVLKQANVELGLREKSIIQADTAPQAQAQILDIVRRLAAVNGFDARGAEQLGEARPFGNDYAEVTVTVPFTCAIEQLVNFLAALANEPVMLASSEIHVSGGSDKKKNIQVRLSLSGVVQKKLLPVRKGPGRS